MRRIVFRLGTLLVGAGLILFVLKQDAVVRESTAVSPDPVLANAPTLNWTNAAVRFVDATVIEGKESFNRILTNAATRESATEKVVVEVVKTRSKYPYIRVETHFKFDAQAQA